MRFASPEDLVIHKMVAGRARDLEDVRGVLLKNPTLDSQYVEHWLREFNKSLGKSLAAQFRSLRSST